MSTYLSEKTLSSIQHIDPSSYQQLATLYDSELETLWFFMAGRPRPVFTPTLLREMQSLFADVQNDSFNNQSIKYLIAASGVPGIYNLGGDLDRFCEFIQSKNADRLREYAYACTDMGHQCVYHFDRDVTSIALVQGNALGGGFEAALCCNIIIAEEQAKFGFPEILFNLFPGVGAYSYLLQRVTMSVADELISSGRMCSAQELLELGVVDVVVPEGCGQQATIDYIKQHRKTRNGRVAMQRAKARLNQLSRAELHDIVDIWVDAALNLEDKDIRMMQRLLNRQSKNAQAPEQEIAVDNIA